MHLLRSIIALATLLSPLTMAVHYYLQEYIAEAHLPRFIAFMEMTRAEGLWTRAAFDRRKQTITFRVMRDNNYLYSTAFHWNEDAEEYFTTPYGLAFDSSRPRKGQKGSKVSKVSKGRN